jgi:hypothetical protein
MSKRGEKPAQLAQWIDAAMGLGVFASVMSGRDPERLFATLRSLADRTKDFRAEIERVAERVEGSASED